MLSRNALGVCVSAVLVAAACGGSKGSSSGPGGAATGGHGTGNGTTGTAGSTASGTGGTNGSSSSGGGGATSSSGTTTSSSGGTTTSSSTSSSGTTSSGSCANFNVVGGIFQAPEPWNTPVDTLAKDGQSDTIINWLSANGGWGNGNKLQIDFSINIQCADATTPMKMFTPSGDFYSPDCDHVPYPVPVGGAVEGETGYACTQDGDCHLLVVDKASNTLYEMWRAFAPPSTTVFNGGCATVWDLTKEYPPNLRGDGCSSADAGGFPMTAMLFTADEVAAGHIDHAIRFILPNARIRDGGVYVHPASHTGVQTSTVTRPSAPPYGVHFRLKPTFNLASLPSNGAQTVAKALQKYGMFLSDGGNIALTAADDKFTKAKWTDANVNVTPTALSVIKVTDFEVVSLGTVVTTGDNCIRNP